jgi:secretory phospholipase A2
MTKGLLCTFAMWLQVQGLYDHDRYVCPDPHKTPFPRPGFVPRTNGCGSSKFVYFQPTTPLLTICCDQHDLCYDTCGVSRAACDGLFLSCMEGVCQAVPDVIENQVCKLEARTMHSLVRLFGSKFFNNAQSKACVCLFHHKRQKGIKLKQVL